MLRFAQQAMTGKDAILIKARNTQEIPLGDFLIHVEPRRDLAIRAGLSEVVRLILPELSDQPIWSTSSSDGARTMLPFIQTDCCRSGTQSLPSKLIGRLKRLNFRKGVDSRSRQCRLPCSVGTGTERDRLATQEERQRPQQHWQESRSAPLYPLEGRAHEGGSKGVANSERIHPCWAALPEPLETYHQAPFWERIVMTVPGARLPMPVALSAGVERKAGPFFAVTTA